PLRALHQPPGDRQRILRAQRSHRPAAPLRGAGTRASAGRRGGALDGRRLRPRPRVRHAPHRGGRYRDRSPHHALHRLRLHPRRDPLSPSPPRTAPRRPGGSRRGGGKRRGRSRGRMSRRGAPFELFLSLRYLRARGQRANLSLFVWIGVGGVFLGVSALIVVLAVMTGFQDGIKERIIAANPHILLLDSGGKGVADAAEIASKVRGVSGGKSATPFVVQQALFTGQGRGAAGGGLPGGRVASRAVRGGVDLAAPSVRAELASEVKAGSLDPLLRKSGEPALLLGRELGRTLGLVPGDVVTVISPQGAMTAVGLVPKMRRFEVAGYVEVGLYEYDASLAYTSLEAAQEFAGLGDKVSGIEVKPDDPFDAKSVGRRLIMVAGPGLWVRDWMGMNRNLFAALQLEKLALFVIVTIIVLVAGFAIIGHLVLLVAEKRKEIGILKAMGAS